MLCRTNVITFVKSSWCTLYLTISMYMYVHMSTLLLYTDKVSTNKIHPHRIVDVIDPRFPIPLSALKISLHATLSPGTYV